MNLVDFFRGLLGQQVGAGFDARGMGGGPRQRLGDLLNSLLPSGTSAREQEFATGVTNNSANAVDAYDGPMAPGTSPAHPGATTNDGINTVPFMNSVTSGQSFTDQQNNGQVAQGLTDFFGHLRPRDPSRAISYRPGPNGTRVNLSGRQVDPYGNPIGPNSFNPGYNNQGPHVTRYVRPLGSPTGYGGTF